MSTETVVPAGVTPFRAGALPGERAVYDMPSFSGTHVLLADVSEFQPNVADAAYLAWSKGMVIRAAYGDAHTDKAWYGGQRRALLHQGGVKFLGIYQYLVKSQSGAAQALALRNLVGSLQKGEVLIADYEEGSGKSVLTGWYNQMVAAYGSGISRYLWTYTGAYFGEANGLLPVQWLAAYQNSEPTSPHTLWQFTAGYSVPGVGSCDCSVYHGTMDQLAALAYGGAAPVPPGPTSGVQSGFRWCHRCQNVTYGINVAKSRCAAGGTHDITGSWVYALPWGPRTSRTTKTNQAGWNWCAKCQDVFFGPNQGKSVCAAYGRHVVGGSYDYLIPYGAPAAAHEPHFRHCFRCENLYYGPNTTRSVCAAGGVHSFGPSWDYNLAYTR